MTIKFDAVVGNPPYQSTLDNTSDEQIYNYFIDAAQEIADIVTLVHPARFLFNAGKTPKKWNKKMLNDKHLSIPFYEQKSDNVFPNTDIKGGVCISFWDKNNNNAGLNGNFIHINELKTICDKVRENSLFRSLDTIVYPQTKVKKALDKKYPTEKRIISSWFDKFPKIFTEVKKDAKDIKIIGLSDGNNRVWRYANKDLIDDPNLKYYKVILPGSNGSGAIGEVLSTPLVGEPLVGCTQTFIQIGRFEREREYKLSKVY